ncbi:MAG: divergent PAP2 family protein [Clostridia bacterium]|nr:divergent PAP2 family protein [Clostridia bacterium]
MLKELLSNRILGCCMIAWISAQIAKALIDGIRHQGWSLRTVLSGSGGMPSSHTAFAGALVMMVGMREGFDSTAFSICFVFLFVVMTDAIGVRRETGRQGSAINLLMDWFTEENESETESQDLKERMGHSPLEVLVGLLWGIGCAILYGE